MSDWEDDLTEPAVQPWIDDTESEDEAPPGTEFEHLVGPMTAGPLVCFSQAPTVLGPAWVDRGASPGLFEASACVSDQSDCSSSDSDEMPALMAARSTVRSVVRPVPSRTHLICFLRELQDPHA